MESKTVELILISGFLGSGKTTFLKELLAHDFEKYGSRIGVIVNEFGSVGIDASLVKDGEIPVVEINRGSVFCACLKDGFVRTLAAFLSQPVDRLYVEASGMADPGSIEKLLLETKPFIEKRYKTDRSYIYRGCVCIVDARRFLKLSAKVPAIESQVRKSNLVVVNKTDCVDASVVSEVLGKIHEINPAARTCKTSFSKVPIEVLQSALSGELSIVEESINNVDNRPEEEIIKLPEAISADEVRKIIRDFDGKYYRVKGFFTDSLGTCYSVNVVEDDMLIEPYEGEIPGNVLICISF